LAHGLPGAISIIQSFGDPVMMTTRFVFSTALTLCSLSLALPAMAQDQAALCDQLAASPVDAARPDGVPGVAFGDIVVAEAEPACRAAWEADHLPRIGYQLARTVYQDGRLEEAQALYEAAAAGGHVDAKIGLGQTTTDIAYARYIALNEEAAKAGSFNAVYNLAVEARDADDDAAKALSLFGQAAAKGDAEAAYNIAVIYDEGEMVVRDVKQARRYYEEAVEGDFGWAKVNLGYLLLEGSPDAADYQRAVDLFRAAADEDDDINAGLQLGIMLQDGSATEQDESETRVIAALQDRDFELARFLQQADTGLSERNLAAIFAELSVASLSEALVKLPSYYAE